MDPAPVHNLALKTAWLVPLLVPLLVTRPVST